jgi:hypothetical protein
MTVWDELKVVLLDLEGSGALAAYPDPRVDEGREPPFEIHLAAWATDAAEDLHLRFADNVELIVGFLRYPECRPWNSTVVVRTSPVVDAMERGIETALVAPVAVSSGHATESAQRVRNMTTNTIIVVPKGYLTGFIVDPRNGRGVGGGAQSYVTARMSDPDTGLVRPVDSQPQIVPFRIMPGGTEVIPLLVDTASALPDLGYAIPAGDWAVRVILELEDGSYLRTPLLPITVMD